MNQVEMTTAQKEIARDRKRYVELYGEDFFQHLTPTGKMDWYMSMVEVRDEHIEKLEKENEELKENGEWAKYHQATFERKAYELEQENKKLNRRLRILRRIKKELSSDEEVSKN